MQAQISKESSKKQIASSQVITDIGTSTSLVRYQMRQEMNKANDSCNNAFSQFKYERQFQGRKAREEIPTNPLEVIATKHMEQIQNNMISLKQLQQQKQRQNQPHLQAWPQRGKGIYIGM